MSESLCLLARSSSFSRTLALELSARYAPFCAVDATSAVPRCDILLCDLDGGFSHIPQSRSARRLGYSRRADADAPFPFLLRPFTMEALWAFLSSSAPQVPLLMPSGGRVTVAGEEVVLTAVEERLFTMLFEADGQAIPRAVLAAALFPDAEKPEDSLRVYVHYLRKKIEKNGRRLLVAENGGYALKRRTE